VTYKVEQAMARLGDVKASKDRRFIVIEVMKDHPYGLGTELKTLEYLFIKGNKCKLHTSKVVLHLEKLSFHSYDISDEYSGNLGFPMLYVLCNTAAGGGYLQIISILTSKSDTTKKLFLYLIRSNIEEDRLLVNDSVLTEKEYQI
jgi:hypothetical protein